MIGQMVAHYRILERIGGGGMGVVYKAEDTKLKRIVALKFLPAELIRDESAKHRFVQEAQAASLLDHQNICTVHDINETEDGRLYICMAYCAGESLKQRLEREPLPVDEAVEVFRQVARGLARAHEAGIIHRDIKPANIMLNDRGEAKLVDFGLAKLTSGAALTESGTTLGTITYMAPEQGRGEAVDPRTDLWSLGVVLFEMLAGRLPFRGEHSHALLYNILHEKPIDITEFRQDLPPQVVECLRRCLTPDRDKRPKTAYDVLEILDGGSGHSTQRLSLFQRRSIPIKSILVVAAAVILALVAWLFWPAPSASPGRTGKQPRVGILLFADHSSRKEIKSLPAILQSLLVQEMTNVRELRVVDPLSLNDFLAQKWGEKAPRPNITNYRLLQELDITQVIDGTIIAEGQNTLLQAWVVDTDSAEVISSRQCRFTSEDDLQNAIRALAREILGDFRVHDLISKMDEDIQPMISAKATNPEALRAFILAGECNYTGNPQADEYLRRSIELDPDFIPPRVWLIPRLLWRSQIPEAQLHYQHLLTLQPNATQAEQVMIEYAGCCMKNDVAGQIRWLTIALDMSPGNNIILYSLGVLRHSLKDYEGCIQALTPSIQRHWRYSPAYYFVGDSYFKIHDYSKAQQCLEASLEVTPVYQEIYSLLAAICTKRGDVQKAKAYEEKYLSISRERGIPIEIAYSDLGDRYYHVEAMHKAVDFLSRATAAGVEDPEKILYLANALNKLQMIDQAIVQYERCLELNPKCSEAHWVLAGIYDDRFNAGRALEHYQSYLQLETSGRQVTVAKERVTKLQSGIR